jgi:hypothetical protein
VSKKIGIKVTLFNDQIPPFENVTEEDISQAIVTVEERVRQAYPDAKIEVEFVDEESGIWHGVEVFESSAIDTDLELEVEDDVRAIKEEFLASYTQAA